MGSDSNASRINLMINVRSNKQKRLKFSSVLVSQTYKYYETFANRK